MTTLVTSGDIVRSLSNNGAACYDSSPHRFVSPTLGRCSPAEKENVEKARKLGCVFTIDCQKT